MSLVGDKNLAIFMIDYSLNVIQKNRNDLTKRGKPLLIRIFWIMFVDYYFIYYFFVVVLLLVDLY